MAIKLKVVEQANDSEIGPAIPPPDFDPAPTRKQHAGWTAERQRRFIEMLSLTGSVGQAAASAGVSSRSAYRLRNKAGAESFASPGTQRRRWPPRGSWRSSTTGRSTAGPSASTRMASW